MLNMQTTQPHPEDTSNRFRTTSKDLAPHELALLEEVKQTAEKLARLMESRGIDRHSALALTNLEQSVMWFKKSLGLAV